MTYTYSEFKKKMLEALSDHFGQDGYELSIQEVQKTNGPIEQIAIRPSESIAMGISLPKLFDSYNNGNSFEKIFSTAKDQIYENLKNLKAMEKAARMFESYENVKNNLFLQVVNTERNAELLSTVPHTDMTDLSLVYRVRVTKGADGVSSTLVTNSLLRQWGIDIETLHKDALASAKELEPSTFVDMKTKMRQLMGPMVDTIEVPNEMWVASIESGTHGASVIAYPGFLDWAAEQMECHGFYIIPSSIHEVLFLPDNDRLNSEELALMIGDVNNQELAPADYLSGHAYHYDAELQRFEDAAEYEMKKEEERNI